MLHITKGGFRFEIGDEIAYKMHRCRIVSQEKLDGVSRSIIVLPYYMGENIGGGIGMAIFFKNAEELEKSAELFFRRYKEGSELNKSRDHIIE